MDDLDSIRERLLEATLPHLPFDGWTDRSLRQGAMAAGIGMTGLIQAFPGGVREAVVFFNQHSNRRLASELTQHNLSELRVSQRIALAVRVRLQILASKREAVRVTCLYLSLPPNLDLASRLLWRDVDAIWYAAGDRSADLSYYTKRAMLVPVWLSTMVYWLDDDSDESSESWAFLERRLASVMRIGKLQCPKLSKVYIPSPWRLARQLRQQGWEIPL